MPTHRVVAIGGSAGGIEATKDLCRFLPLHPAAGFFIVIHVGATGRNLLAGILDSCAPFPVTTAVDGERVQVGHAYVAPTDHHLLVLDDTIRLGRGPRENMARPAIDPMFRSIGISYGSHAIGVLLSGRLNDGSAGLADLKRCGGLTVVQNPTDAAEAEMPLSALSASGVDYRAPAAELGPLLAKLLAEEPSPSVAPPPDIALEVEIALGQPVDTDMIARIGQPVALSCPACGGVMSQMKHGPPLRFRCQVGHAYTAEALSKDQEGAVDEAIRVALRIIEERAALTQKMAQDAHRNGRIRTAAQWDERVREYRTYAETLRQAAIKAEDQA